MSYVNVYLPRQRLPFSSASKKIPKILIKHPMIYNSFTLFEVIGALSILLKVLENIQTTEVETRRILVVFVFEGGNYVFFS